MLLVSLDLSAAFDMVEHATLLKRRSCSFGISDVAYSWIRSYLDGRTQSVRMSSYSSAVTSCSVGVPKDPSRGHYCSLHTSPLSTIAKSQQVFQ